MMGMAGQSTGLSGSIVEVEPDVWRVRLSLGRDTLTGKPRQLERRVRGTRKAAERVLANLHLSPDAERRKDGTPITVGELLDRFLAHRERLGREALTIEAYRAHVERVRPLIGAKKLSALRPEHLDDLYGRLLDADLSAATVGRYHATMRAALKWGRRMGWVESVATDLATVPRVPKFRPEQATVDQVLEAITSAEGEDPSLALGILLAVATGCRRGEVCGLQWADLDGMRLTVSRSVVTVKGRQFVKDTKTHADRSLMLDAGTVAAVELARPRAEAWAAEVGTVLAVDAFVIADPGDPSGRTPRKPDWLTSGWIRHAERTGCPGRLHDLRHLQASLLLAEGLPVKDVADRLGHASATTTMNIYAHVLAGRDQMAADIIGAKLKRS